MGRNTVYFKKQHQLFLVATLLFLLISANYASLIPSATAETLTPEEQKGLSILSNVMSLDVGKYAVTLKEYSQNYSVDYLSSFSQKTVGFNLNSSTSKLNVLCSFANGNLHMIQVLENEGSPSMSKTLLNNNAGELAKDFLSNYQAYTNDPVYGALSIMLDSVDGNKNLTQTSDNSQLEVSAISGYSAFKWEFMSNGVVAPSKFIGIGFANGSLTYFIDNWSIYQVENTDVNLSEKEAIAIALQAAKSHSWSFELDKDAFDMKNFNESNVRWVSLIFDSSEGATNTRSADSLKLYPVWRVAVALNRWYENLYGVEVDIWADTKEVRSVEEAWSTLTPQDLMQSENLVEMSQTRGSDLTDNHGVTLSSLGMLSSLSFVFAFMLITGTIIWIIIKKNLTLGLHKRLQKTKATTAMKRRLPQLITSLLIGFLIVSSLNVSMQTPMVEATTPTGGAVVWGSESIGAYNPSLGYSLRKNNTEVEAQKQVASHIAGCFNACGYVSYNHQGNNSSGSLKESIMANLTTFLSLYDKLAVVDFDHGVGLSFNNTSNSTEFHFMFEDNNGTKIGQQFPLSTFIENGVFDMDIYNLTSWGEVTFAFINTCMSANYNNLNGIITLEDNASSITQGILNPNDPPSQWRARSMPFAWTHRTVANMSDQTQWVGIAYNMSADGYAHPDGGPQVYIGFPFGSASLTQKIPYENGTQSYDVWVRSFFSKALNTQYPMTVTQALDSASILYCGTYFGNSDLRKGFGAYWWEENKTDIAYDGSTMAVYGNGDIFIQNPAPITPAPVPAPTLQCLTSPTWVDTRLSFDAGTVSPENDIYYTFDWGDNTPRFTTGPNASGVSGLGEHTYGFPGQYNVTVCAVDSEGNHSVWSTPLMINVENLPLNNTAPSTPILDGPLSGYVNTTYVFSANATDPEGNDIRYTFNWDDGTGQITIGPLPSEETVYAIHNWTSAGQFAVTVKATDIVGASSNWSDPLVINIQELPLPPQQRLNIIDSGSSGTTDPPSGIYYYNHGSQVQVRAIPSDGCTFLHWIYDGATYCENPITITLDTVGIMHNLCPVFYQPPTYYPLYFSASDNQDGVVTPDVYLDGEYMGTMSNQVFYVLPGTHTLQVSVPDGLSFQNWTSSDGYTYYSNPIGIYVGGSAQYWNAHFIRTLPQPVAITGPISSLTETTSNGNQRKTFYANDHFWTFYTTSDHLHCISSTDGVTWSDVVGVSVTVSFGYNFDVHYDGTNIHLVWTSPGGYGSNPPPGLYYKRGTPNSDGTMNWGAQQTVCSPTSGVLNYKPSITVDSNGFPWIAYQKVQYEPSVPGYAETVYVTKSSLNNGIWSTADGFPYQLTTPNGGDTPTVLPLSTGKTLVLYGGRGQSDPICAQRWDGSNWSASVATPISAISSKSYSAVAQGDDAQLIYVTSTNNSIVHVTYNYTTHSFSPETIIQSSVGSLKFPVLAKTDADDLYAFWAGSPYPNHIYFKKYTKTTGTWDANQTDWIYDQYLTNTYHLLTCSQQNNFGKIGLLYLTNCVKFDYLNAPTTYPLCMLEVDYSPGGTTNLPPNTYTYEPSTPVLVTATSNPGFSFDHWLLDSEDAGNNSTILITMDSNHSLVPIFTLSSAIGRVQGSFRGTATGTATSINVTLTNQPISGNVLVAVVGAWAGGYQAQSITSISQTGVNWSRQVSSSSTNIVSEIWLGTVGADASTSITINLENQICYYGDCLLGIADVCEYEGVSLFDPLDKSAIRHGTSSDDGGDGYGYEYTGTTETTSQTDELWIGGIFSFLNGPMYASSNTGNGFTLFDGLSTGKVSCLGYLEKIVSSTGQAHSGVKDVEFTNYYGCIATFKAGTNCTLTITSGAGGTTNPQPGTYSYEQGSNVQVMASNSSGFHFDYWNIDGQILYDNPIIVTMDSNHTLQAYFAEQQTAVVFQDGFESGNFSAWSSYNGTPTIVSSPVNEGTYAANATGPDSYWLLNLEGQDSTIFFAGYVQFPQLQSNDETTYCMVIADEEYTCSVWAGSYVYGNYSYWLLSCDDEYLSTSANIQTNHWYFMEIEYNTNGSINMWIDGILVASATGQSLPNNAATALAGNPWSGTHPGFISYGDNYTIGTRYIPYI
ncbi:MAG: PKD domain-containing protein [Candidatus Bathyarchaeota archaeon]|nr:PKD domain-containing protein [Candidatus Bathyarchaeota archaeon]